MVCPLKDNYSLVAITITLLFLCYLLVLSQQDVIGQNLADITHPEYSSKISDSLKPSLIISTSVEDDFVVSQYRQFFVRLKPSVAYSTSPSHSVRCVLYSLSLSLSLFLFLFPSVLCVCGHMSAFLYTFIQSFTYC